MMKELYENSKKMHGDYCVWCKMWKSDTICRIYDTICISIVSIIDQFRINKFIIVYNKKGKYTTGFLAI